MTNSNASSQQTKYSEIREIMEQTGASPDGALNFYNNDRQTTWKINKEKIYLIIAGVVIIICICFHKRISAFIPNIISFISTLIK